MKAIDKNRIDVAKYLLTTGMDLNFEVDMGKYRYPLLAASDIPDGKIALLLLDYGADATIEQRYEYSALTVAIPHKNHALIESLISKKVSINYCGVGCATPPILLALEAGDLVVAKRLAEKGASLEIVNLRNFHTPIISAVLGGSLEAVEWVFEQEAPKLTGTNIEGHRPVDIALDEGFSDIARFLMEKGAQEKKYAFNDEPRLDYAVWAHRRNSSQRGVVELLISRGYDVNGLNSEGDSPIVTATESGDLEMVKLLHKYGASLKSQDHNNTLIELALEYRHSEILQYLIDNGFDIDENAAIEAYISNIAYGGTEVFSQVLMDAGISCCSSIATADIVRVLEEGRERGSNFLESISNNRLLELAGEYVCRTQSDGGHRLAYELLTRGAVINGKCNTDDLVSRAAADRRAYAHNLYYKALDNEEVLKNPAKLPLFEDDLFRFVDRSLDSMSELAFDWALNNGLNNELLEKYISEKITNNRYGEKASRVRYMLSSGIIKSPQDWVEISISAKNLRALSLLILHGANINRDQGKALVGVISEFRTNYRGPVDGLASLVVDIIKSGALADADPDTLGKFLVKLAPEHPNAAHAILIGMGDRVPNNFLIEAKDSAQDANREGGWSYLEPYLEERF